MEKIQMPNPIVEMNGDEMTRVIWENVKQELILPYVDVNSLSFDLGAESMASSGEAVLSEAAAALSKFGLGVRCASLNSPKIRQGLCLAIRGAAVFKKPIRLKGINPAISTWKKPVILARQTQASASEENIRDYALTCFNYALAEESDLWFSSREDNAYRKAFDEAFAHEYAEAFEEKGLKYEYVPFPEASGKALRSEGGFIWAMSNADSDIAAGFVQGAFSMPAMMLNITASPDGKVIYEAAHSTGQRLYGIYTGGGETSANSVATILSWTDALKRSAEKDGNRQLKTFACRMEEALENTTAAGYITKDMAPYAEGAKVLGTFEFIKKVRDFFEGKAVLREEPEARKIFASEASAKPIYAAHTATNDPDDKDLEEMYDAFLDARSYKEKREILRQIGGRLTDKMITDFAVSLDVVVDEGSFDKRYLSLMNCLNQMCKFETEGLR